ncbi:MAG: Crp/Fnr family transcriptional regulator, partial [Bacteroidales bacterium]
MERIIESIKKEIQISDETIGLLREFLKPIEVSKKTLLIDPFTKDGNLYIVERGIARAFTVIEGKEITSWFSQEGDLLYSTNSFHGKTEGYEEEMVQVLEDSL